MIPRICDLMQIEVLQQTGKHQRREVLGNRRVNRSNTDFIRVQNVKTLTIGVEELHRAHINGTSAAGADKAHNGKTRIYRLKGAMHKLCEIDGGGVNPL